MAWVTEYDMSWNSGTSSGYIYLQRDGGSYITSLTLHGESLEIRNVIPSWDQPVAKMNCTFAVQNDMSDFYTLLPLMTISNGQIKVVVTHSGTSSTEVVIFEGYLNCEAVNQQMLQYSNIRLTASGYLSKLDNEYPTSLDTLQYMSLIDLIIDCLTLTGSVDPIYVNIDLYENNSTPSASQTLFNRNAAFSELFWENNVDRMSALTILETIMRSFNCYLFWYDQKWYIEHYADLNETKSYVIYDPVTSGGYGYTDTGTTDSWTLYQQPIHQNPDFMQVGETQYLKVNPGLKILDFRMNLKQYFNFFWPDLADMFTSVSSEPVLQNRRQWWNFGSVNVEWPTAQKGEAFRNIANSAYRSGYDITTGSNQMNGLSTRFAITVHEDTEVVIKFKFGVFNASTFFITILKEDTITFPWYLAIYDDTPANRDYFVYDEDTETWSLEVDGDPEVDFNELTISVGDLDEDLHTYEGTLTIPVGTVISTSSGDEDHVDLCFRMGTEYAHDTSGTESDTPASGCYYGDFEAVINETPRGNLIRGTVVTDFRDKKTITLDLFDAGWSYRNSIFRFVTASRYDLAEDWTYPGLSGIDSLENHLMRAKYQIYRIARQKISMDLFSTDQPLLPLIQPWVDSKQSNMVFVILSTIFKPQENIQSVELHEYDNLEVINLV
jgi:hypothetical protein